MEELFEQEEQLVEPTPTPTEKKVKAKVTATDINTPVEKPCKDCPDYSKEDLLREKVLMFKSQGYNDNQVASMLGVHKQYVESIK